MHETVRVMIAINRALTARYVIFSILTDTAVVAQWVKRLIRKQRVWCSNPSRNRPKS